jgi:hypothetical protein
MKTYKIIKLNNIHITFINAFNRRHATMQANKWLRYKGLDPAMYVIKEVTPSQETADYINNLR